jgi:tripartite ATP-independent transporter DctM subunit
MSIVTITILLFVCLIVLLITGLPIAFVMGATGLIFAFFVMGLPSLGIIANSMVGIMTTFTMLAIPLFILMANVLERSGVADDLYAVMHYWFGSVRGGLAMGTVVICTVFAAMCGVSAAGTVTMGVIALPAMLKRGYGKEIAVGCISAGGALGPLIPPSILLIVYALLAGESVGGLFLGGAVPGFILAALFIIYIGIRCFLQPELGPALPPEERVSWIKKLISLKGVILPILLVIGVMGSIFGGIATPTEAAAVGAFGSLVCAAIYRRLNWVNLTSALYGTLRLTCMILWLILGGTVFSSVYTAIGAQQFIVGIVEAMAIDPWLIMIMMQIIWIFLGMLMDPGAILFITAPVFLPVITTLGFDRLWFGVLWMVNMEMGFLTPPFGLNLFYMKSIVPKEISMGDIYRSIIPFVLLQLIGLIICMIFPQTILWLPKLVMGG